MRTGKVRSNPIITSEMKIKMRGWRTALGIAAYLGVLMLIGFLYYMAFIQTNMSWNSSVNARQEAGMQIYIALAVVQFALILLITPAQTAGTVSGEREKQTLDLLLATKISSVGIIFGKLISSMSYILLLIITSIPLFSLIFLFGGVTPGDMLQLFIFYMITAFAVGSIGIFYSTLFKRTVMSTVVTYITIFFLGMVSVILGAYMISIQYSGTMPQPSNPTVPFVLYINPAVGLADILVTEPGGFSTLLGLSIGPVGRLDFWIVNSMVMLVVAAMLLIISMYKINPVRRISFKKGKKRK